MDRYINDGYIKSCGGIRTMKKICNYCGNIFEEDEVLCEFCGSNSLRDYSEEEENL